MKLKNDPTVSWNIRPPRPGVKVATVTSVDLSLRCMTTWYAASRTMAVVPLVVAASLAAAEARSAGIANRYAPVVGGTPADRAKSVGSALISAPDSVLLQ